MRHFLFSGVAFALFFFVLSVPDFCTLPKDEGTASDQQPQVFVYYNSTRGVCYPFKYFGPNGNANRFANERECMRNCSAQAEEVYPMDETKACHLPKAPGNSECPGVILRFYYDSIHDKCKNFFFTGCQGNGNRFIDRQSCNRTCDGIHDDGDAEEEEEPDTPIGVIFGSLFGVVGAIIIIVVIVLTLQSRKGSEGKTKKQEAKTEIPLKGEDIEMA